MSWRISTEPAVAVFGAGRALLLQVLHPLVAAGVEDHSNYRTEPWRRLYRTVDTVMKLAFADPATSAQRARRLHARHTKVIGTSPEGVAYRALDPDLLVWVWATLIDTAALVFRRAVGPLSAADLEEYYEESTLLAQACGVPVGGYPCSWASFQEYMAATIDTSLRVTPTARAVADSLVHPKLPSPLWPLSPLVGAAVAYPTAALLPARFAEDLDLPRSPRAVDAAFAAARGLATVTPGGLRRMSLGPFIGWSSRRRASTAA